MPSSVRSQQSARAENTREALLTAAERLIAERGVEAVTHRQIVTAAAQGNNAAVAYHFGTKKDLVRAIDARHAGHIDGLRAVRVAAAGDAPDLRAAVVCLVAPLTDHLASLPPPTWYARFAAQVMTDPTYRRVVTKSALESESLRHAVEHIGRCLPDLPQHVRAERTVMMRTMLMYTCAEIERGLTDGSAGPRSDWPGAAAGLIDAIVGLWQAAVTER